MSENIIANQARERTQSLFDMLINNSRNETENSSYMHHHQHQHQHHQQMMNQQQPANISREEGSAITSSFIENLLTEYLISLPSSLEEFYKIMGEIYVAEILKRCPTISSPVELMKETLLGRFNNTSEDGSSKAIFSTMIKNILQSNAQSANASQLESQVIK